MQSNNIPDWLTGKDDYIPESDKSKFIDKSTKQILSALSRFRKNGYIAKAKRCNTALRLFGVLLAVVLTALAKNFYFVFFMLAVTTVLLAVSDSHTIKNVLKVLVPAEIISVLILLPGALMGNPHSLISITARVFVSVSLVMRFNLTTPFNQITSALKSYRVPDIIIFVFDLTIQYISILSQICFEMLTALKVRSIGRNPEKSKAVSGILGTTFIKAKECAQTTQQAMECRGFDGTFTKNKKNKFSKYDLTYLAALIILIGVFIYFQAVIQ